jgi:hypothetical protein
MARENVFFKSRDKFIEAVTDKLALAEEASGLIIKEIPNSNDSLNRKY